MTRQPIVIGVTRKHRTLRVTKVQPDDPYASGWWEIEIDGQVAEVWQAHTYRGRVGRTYMTNCGFVRIPFQMGDEVLPSAFLDGEPVAATVEQAERWSEVMFKRLQAFTAARLRIADAESGRTAASASTGAYGIPQTLPSTRPAIDTSPATGIRRALASFLRRYPTKEDR